jgi:hypothetical protein
MVTFTSTYNLQQYTDTTWKSRLLNAGLPNQPVNGVEDAGDIALTAAGLL